MRPTVTLTLIVLLIVIMGAAFTQLVLLS